MSEKTIGPTASNGVVELLENNLKSRRILNITTHYEWHDKTYVVDVTAQTGDCVQRILRILSDSPETVALAFSGSFGGTTTKPASTEPQLANEWRDCSKELPPDYTWVEVRPTVAVRSAVDYKVLLSGQWRFSPEDGYWHCDGGRVLANTHDQWRHPKPKGEPATQPKPTREWKTLAEEKPPTGCFLQVLRSCNQKHLGPCRWFPLQNAWFGPAGIWTGVWVDANPCDKWRLCKVEETKPANPWRSMKDEAPKPHVLVELKCSADVQDILESSGPYPGRNLFCLEEGKWRCSRIAIWADASDYWRYPEEKK